MSFIWFSPTGPLRTREDVAKVIYDTALKRGLEKTAAVLAVMCTSVESNYWCPWNSADGCSQNYPFDSQSNDGRSVGYFQQQNGVPGENPTGSDNWWGSMQSRMSLDGAADTFMARIPDNYLDVAVDATSAGEIVANIQGCAVRFRGLYATKWDEAWALINPIVAAENPVVPVSPEPTPIPEPAPPEAPVASQPKPAYNEFPVWCANNESRGNVKPYLFIIHTQEGGGGDSAAEDLANFCISTTGGDNPVSYHYYISQASDGGVTLVDGVDTDFASWSVGDANDYSINLCFAGSS